MDLSHLGLKLGGCNNEVAALKSDHNTEVTLYYYFLYNTTPSNNNSNNNNNNTGR